MTAVLPGCEVVGVQSEAAPAMTLSWRAGRPIDTESADSCADGIATRISIPRAVELMAGRVHDMRLVTEDLIRTAQQELTKALGITVEAAGQRAGPPSSRAAWRPCGPVRLVVTGRTACGASPVSGSSRRPA